MKKSIICVITAILMIVQSLPLAYASVAEPDEHIDVNIDMQVKRSKESTYENGPISVAAVNANFDFKTIVDMSSVFASFNNWCDKADAIIDNLVALDNTLNRDELIAALNASEVTSEFVVDIVYPKSIKVPDAFKANSRSMYGFNDDAKDVYYEKSRTFESDYDENNSRIEITIGTKDKGSDTNAAPTIGSLRENKEAYFKDLTLTAEGVTLPSAATYTAKGTMEGYLRANGQVGGKNYALYITFSGVQTNDEDKINSKDPSNISATVVLTRSSSGSSSGGSSSGTTILPGQNVTPSVAFNIDGTVIRVISVSDNKILPYEDLPVPEKEGYSFAGWYYDSELTNKVEGDVTVTEDMKLYSHWISQTINTEDHFAYIIGYPDGTIRPNNNISREEIATIFCRLMRPEKLASIASTENNFTDVSADRWSNKAISALANGGYVNGYEDGTFAPAKYITRAEFASLAIRFAMAEASEAVPEFSDIKGHWAYNDILKAASEGWVNGYEDGTFGPEKYITRAEAMAIINRVLVRHVDAEGFHADAKIWSDISSTSDWYYYIVEEATNSHTYTRREDGKLEKWVEITPNRTWPEL